ncbi:hypothetical protein PDM89_11930 [Bacillus cereus]|nr:hypothetical protein [Bacillus cereus]
MMHLSKKTKFLNVEQVTENMDTWINRSYITEPLKEELQKANVLILPKEGFRDYKEPVFPIGTEDIYIFFKEHSNEKFSPEICIEDKDYKELALHSSLLILGSFAVTVMVAPIFVDVISHYLEKKTGDKIEECDVNIKVTVVEEDKSTCIHYQGRAADFSQSFTSIVKSLEKE